MTERLDVLLAEALTWPSPRISFGEELLQALWTSHHGGRFTQDQVETDKDARWVVLGAVGAAGAACFAIYRRHHRKGAA
jgi:hypothetical protein